ncbi:2-dehydro-3-deoxygalactonokinase [Sphingomonas sp. AR_OL41]|nr:2-dehydro-3-deoxygalactonokinase [Sphingomonas sp. AR_OL41]MDH7973919.1 2-dehydro-3-deoxygalactonokinase [Sphingomonas sp. AR_OL41]
MTPDTFLAVDWGTTSRRVYRIERDGTVAQSALAGPGVRRVAPHGFESELAFLRSTFGDLPMLLAGMVGSNLGWTEVPYVSAPCGIEELAAGAHWVEPGRTAIMPGVCQALPGRADVMRGEEVQFLGAVVAGLVPRDAIVCQPGTHSKWATLAQGRLVTFATTMTGEIYALLRGGSVLAEMVAGPVTAGAAFLEGVARSRDGALATQLFEIRAAALLGVRPGFDHSSYLSGLLIGHEVRSQGRCDTDDIFVLAEPALGELYIAAISACGRGSRLIGSQQAFVAGSARAWSLLA